MNTWPKPICEEGELAAWRKSLDPSDTVAVVAGNFHMLQPGNLAAVRRAKQLAKHVVVVLEPDPLPHEGGGHQPPPSEARPHIPLAERLEIVSHLRDVDLAISFATGDAGACLAGLKPYTWVYCRDHADGPLVGARQDGGLPVRREPLPDETHGPFQPYGRSPIRAEASR